jgi:hypothetical protein
VLLVLGAAVVWVVLVVPLCVDELELLEAVLVVPVEPVVELWLAPVVPVDELEVLAFEAVVVSAASLVGVVAKKVPFNNG